MQVESDGIGHIGGGEDGKKGDYSPVLGNGGRFCRCLSLRSLRIVIRLLGFALLTSA